MSKSVTSNQHPKPYFTLTTLAKIWELSEDDLIHYASRDFLKLSVIAAGWLASRVVYGGDDEPEVLEQLELVGLQEISAADAGKFILSASVKIHQFPQCNGTQLRLDTDAYPGGMDLARDDLVITTFSKKHFEERHGALFKTKSVADKPKRGRPNNTGAIVNEMERRAKAGLLLPKLADEAREMEKWSHEYATKVAGYEPVQFNSIRSRLYKKYKEFKELYPQK